MTGTSIALRREGHSDILRGSLKDLAQVCRFTSIHFHFFLHTTSERGILERDGILLRRYFGSQSSFSGPNISTTEGRDLCHMSGKSKFIFYWKNYLKCFI